MLDVFLAKRSLHHHPQLLLTTRHVAHFKHRFHFGLIALIHMYIDRCNSAIFPMFEVRLSFSNTKEMYNYCLYLNLFFQIADMNLVVC